MQVCSNSWRRKVQRISIRARRIGPPMLVAEFDLVAKHRVTITKTEKCPDDKDCWEEDEVGENQFTDPRWTSPVYVQD